MDRDHVDTILEQWQRERPDLDASPMGVIGRIVRVSSLLQRELEEVFARFGLTGPDFDVLATLRRSGTAQTPSALGRSLMVSSGGMTKRLDRLEDAGLVARTPDPNDRRGVLIELTSAGKRLIDAAVEAHIENEQRLLAALTPAQRASLEGLLRGLSLSLDDTAS